MANKNYYNPEESSSDVMEVQYDCFLPIPAER